MATLLSQLHGVLATWDAAAALDAEASTAAIAVPSPRGALSYAPVRAFEGSGANSPEMIPVDFFTTVGGADAADKDGANTANRKSAGTTADPHAHIFTFPAADLQDPRRALSKLELARASLALFTSNAGEYRPILQKVLRFLFEYIDYLVEDRSRLIYEATNVPAGGYHPGGGGGEEEHSDVVAAAYQKVRLVETRMGALAEEASAQRDRFKAQIATLQRHQAKLETLLRHQMELNHVILQHPLDGMDPGLSAPNAMSAMDAAVRSTNAAGGLTLPDRSDFDAGGRDAAYVKRLVARAEKEKVLEDMEIQVRELLAEQNTLSDKIASLQRLNSRYARQAVELSARISIIHEHNISLATDVQLCQRDVVRETQRSEKLLRDATISKGMLLTLLEARSREVIMAMAAGGGGGGGGRGSKSITRTAKLLAASSEPQDNPLQDSEGETSEVNSQAETTTSEVSLSISVPAARSNFQLGPQANIEDRVEEALFTVQDRQLRKQLQEILAINDVAHGGATKSALLSILNLKQQSRYSHIDFNENASGPVTRHNAVARLAKHQGEIADVDAKAHRDHLWSAPFGRGPQVPRHLRTQHCVQLLPFHPRVAECFIHELLTQRQELLEYAWREAEASALVSGVIARPNKKKQQLEVSTSATEEEPKRRLMPLDEFIELFINVVWLNSDERFAPLLPDPVRKILAEEREALRVGNANAASETAAKTQVTWQLHTLIHSIRPPEEMLRLTPEGLKLTYSLDIVSRRPDSGFLAYIYGIASRQQVGEVIFDVLRSERAVFLSLCKRVERDRAAAMRGSQASPGSPMSPDDYASGTSAVGDVVAMTAAAVAPRRVSNEREGLFGCIPMVQLARILCAMFPTYSQAKIEQLVLAAAEDGTEFTESPVMVYYTLLLPDRLLPGLTASSAEAGVFWREGHFASLFYKAIADDALEAMQVLEDSVNGFGRAAAQGQQTTDGEAAPSLGPSATAKQLCAFSFKGVPRHEERLWGPALRSVVMSWPRLKPQAGAALGTPASMDSQGAFGARVAVAELMPYVRKNLVLRRACHMPMDKSEAADDDDASLEFDSVLDEMSPVWTPSHVGYVSTLAEQWDRFAEGEELPSDVTYFMRMISTADPKRYKVWGSVDVGEGNIWLRTPLHLPVPYSSDEDEAPSVTGLSGPLDAAGNRVSLTVDETTAPEVSVSVSQGQSASQVAQQEGDDRGKVSSPKPPGEPQTENSPRGRRVRIQE